MLTNKVLNYNIWVLIKKSVLLFPIYSQKHIYSLTSSRFKYVFPDTVEIQWITISLHQICFKAHLAIARTLKNLETYWNSRISVIKHHSNEIQIKSENIEFKSHKNQLFYVRVNLADAALCIAQLPFAQDVPHLHLLYVCMRMFAEIWDRVEMLLNYMA